MKNNSYLSFLFIGISAGLFSITFYSLIEFIDTIFKIPTFLIHLTQGLGIGISFATTLLFCNQQLYHNTYKLYKSLFHKVLWGAFIGVFSFGIFELRTFPIIDITTTSPFFEYFFMVQKWIFFSIGITILYNFKENSNLVIIIGIGILLGILMFLLVEGTILVFPNNNSLLYLSFIFSGILFSFILPFFAEYKNQSWLKGLNGNLAGIKFRLKKPIYYIGSQPSDHIYLSQYKEVHPAQVKVIHSCDDIYLLDNDPFQNTQINFRPVQDQPLKSGDIIKVGSALFQFCQKKL